jgi:hypothetical protein
MTGGKATQSDRVGDMVSAWDDYITGQNVELVPGQRIVQTWRTTQFTDEHPDSTITVTLATIPGGTRLTLEHANVPDDQTGYEQDGWREHYFEPMQRYFATMTKVAAVAARAMNAAKKKAPAKKKTAAKKAAPKNSARKKTTKKNAAVKKSAVKRRTAKKSRR